MANSMENKTHHEFLTYRGWKQDEFLYLFEKHHRIEIGTDRVRLKSRIEVVSCGSGSESLS